MLWMNWDAKGTILQGRHPGLTLAFWQYLQKQSRGLSHLCQQAQWSLHTVLEPVHTFHKLDWTVMHAKSTRKMQIILPLNQLVSSCLWNINVSSLETRLVWFHRYVGLATFPPLTNLWWCVAKVYVFETSTSLVEECGVGFILCD